MPTYVMMNICAKFHRNLSSNYGDTVSRKIDVNGQRTTGGQPSHPHNALRLLLLTGA